MSDVSRVQTKDKTLVDPIYESPVDQYQHRARRRNLIILLVVIVGIVLLVRRWLM